MQSIHYPSTGLGHYKGYTLADFKALCELLDTVEGSYILSNYDQPVQPQSAQDCIEIEATMSAANGKDRAKTDIKRIEKLWVCDRSKGMRSDIAKIATKSKKQLSLF